MSEYSQFIANKSQLSGNYGFEPVFMPDKLFDFQKHLVEWACRKGRSAIFADCGLGKTFMQLSWAQNVAQKTNGRVLILTPLAVSFQTVKEGEKIGVEVSHRREGIKESDKIVVTNYERMHYFSPHDFAGVVCDESSILKNFAGSTREAITKFMSQVKYRMLCTATAAPNDFMELGTSSEALGYMKHREMLSMYFSHDGGEPSKWTIKGHAAKGPFWSWMCSWSRAIRNPADLGFSSHGFDLPELKIRRHIAYSNKAPDGFLFNLPAVGLDEQRDERRRTLKERCEMSADLIYAHKDSSVAWCHLNSEGDMLSSMIPGSVQISGSDSDERKEETFRAFESGQVRVIVTKPTIAGFGLNWQHCHHQTFFPSHSFEQWYQAIRRCWRFGQKNPVIVDVISSDGEADVVSNLERKAAAADLLFEQLVRHMNEQTTKETKQTTNTEMRIPSWL